MSMPKERHMFVTELFLSDIGDKYGEHTVSTTDMVVEVLGILIKPATS
jgi:hypothetical protein